MPMNFLAWASISGRAFAITRGEGAGYSVARSLAPKSVTCFSEQYVVRSSRYHLRISAATHYRRRGQSITLEQYQPHQMITGWINVAPN
jgi:hypothetical protein